MKRITLLTLILSTAGPTLRAAPEPPAPDADALPELVHAILTDNPELQFYVAEIAAARAGVHAAGTSANPELALDLGRRRRLDAAGMVAGEGTAWGVSVTQTFEWPGRLALRKAVANRQLELAQLGLDGFRAALRARASTLAFGLAAATEKAAAVREVAERFAALKETFLARDPAGITPLLETRVIEAQELALQRRATEAELAAQAARLELNQLRGAGPDTAIAPATARLSFHDAPATEALLAAARANNFDFRSRQVELAQQDDAVRLARSERHSAISVSPYYSEAKAGETERNFGVGVSLPLPLTSRSRAGVDLASARQRQAGIAVLVAERELTRAVLTAAHAFQAKAREARRWTPEAVSGFRDAAALADRHYRLGAVPIATYVELQASYLDAVESLLDTEREALEAGLQLQHLTGLDFNAVEVRP